MIVGALFHRHQPRVIGKASGNHHLTHEANAILHRIEFGLFVEGQGRDHALAQVFGLHNRDLALHNTLINGFFSIARLRYAGAIIRCRQIVDQHTRFGLIFRFHKRDCAKTKGSTHQEAGEHKQLAFAHATQDIHDAERGGFPVDLAHIPDSLD